MIGPPLGPGFNFCHFVMSDHHVAIEALAKLFDGELWVHSMQVRDDF